VRRRRARAADWPARSCYACQPACGPDARAEASRPACRPDARGVVAGWCGGALPRPGRPPGGWCRHLTAWPDPGCSGLCLPPDAPVELLSCGLHGGRRADRAPRRRPPARAPARRCSSGPAAPEMDPPRLCKPGSKTRGIGPWLSYAEHWHVATATAAVIPSCFTAAVGGVVALIKIWTERPIMSMVTPYWLVAKSRSTSQTITARRHFLKSRLQTIINST